MALNKKGSRRITVGGIEYRWRIRRKPSYMQGLCWTPLTYAVEAASGSQPGTTLIVTSGQTHPSNWVGAEAVPIRPAHVAAGIREARDRGWEPTKAGFPFQLDRSARVHRPAIRQSEEKQPISVELLHRLQAWFAEHEERLQSCGITGAVQQSPEDAAPVMPGSPLRRRLHRLQTALEEREAVIRSVLKQGAAPAEFLGVGDGERAVTAADRVVAQHSDGDPACPDYGPSEPLPELPADSLMLAVEALDEAVSNRAELAEQWAEAANRSKWRQDVSPPPRRS